MKQKNTLIYVDRNLSIATAANLVGVMTSKSDSESSKVGLNWLISASVDESSSTAKQYDIREMLPEDLAYYYHERIENRFENLTELIPLLTTGIKDSLIPGNVISVYGKLTFPNFQLPTNYSPFEPVEIDIKSYLFHGEDCMIAELKNEDYRIPVYLPTSSKYQVAFCHNQPVEITGIVRWTPPYSPGGRNSSNLAIRGALVWLR